MMRDAAIACVCCGVLALTACTRTAPDEKADALRATTERGPLKLVAEVRPSKPRVGDVVRVVLAMDAPAECEVQFPPAKDLGAALEAREIAGPGPLPGATGRAWRQEYQFTALTGGPLEIPELAVRYTLQATSAPTASQVAGGGSELVIGPLKLEVASVLKKDEQPTSPRDITGTLLPPRPPLPLWQKLALAGALAAVVLAGGLGGRALWRWWHRPPAPILPEVWALRELRTLELTDWLSPDEARRTYYRLTEIVRQYIERKFALAAPEMTSEEFLVMLARHRGALPYEPERIRTFLEACDIVKYAAVHPRREDGENVLATARNFVTTTAVQAIQGLAGAAGVTAATGAPAAEAAADSAAQPGTSPSRAPADRASEGRP
jgi:hypothetical protein